MIIKQFLLKPTLTFFIVALFISSTTVLAFQSVKLASTISEIKQETSAPAPSQTTAPAKKPTPSITEVAPAINDTPATPERKKAIRQAPAPANPAPQTETEKIIEETESGGQVAIVSEDGVTATDVATYNALANTTTIISAPDQIPFKDETGKNANLETPLKNFFKDNLLWTGAEIKQMRQIIITDCADCGWNGNYTGSYSTNGDTITDAFGWITLNVRNYKDSKYLIDYMKIVLSHEYGHHWSLYYKWTALNLGVGTRFPDNYYSTRPLSKEKTTSDYSLGWDHCDGEIVAEDYQYFYSGYSTHAMKDLFSLPSEATKKWLADLGSADSPINSTPPTKQTTTDDPTTNTASQTNDPAKATPPPATSNTAPAETTPTPDITKPVVTIAKPTSSSYEWTSGDLAIEASATDNVGVEKMSVYINDTLVGSVDGSGLVVTWHYDRAQAGQYIFKITAQDSAGNIGEAIITITKISETADLTQTTTQSPSESKQAKQTNNDESERPEPDDNQSNHQPENSTETNAQ